MPIFLVVIFCLLIFHKKAPDWKKVQAHGQPTVVTYTQQLPAHNKEEEKEEVKYEKNERKRRRVGKREEKRKIVVSERRRRRRRQPKNSPKRVGLGLGPGWLGWLAAAAGEYAIIWTKPNLKLCWLAGERGREGFLRVGGWVRCCVYIKARPGGGENEKKKEIMGLLGKRKFVEKSKMLATLLSWKYESWSIKIWNARVFMWLF